MKDPSKHKREKNARREQPVASNVNFEQAAHQAPEEPDPDVALDFFEKFFGDSPRQLTAIKKKTPTTKEHIVTRTFNAPDRAGPTEFGHKYQAQGYEIYFTINRIKAGAENKKPTKNDMAAAQYLWGDHDPPKGLATAVLDTWRAATRELITTKRPPSLPAKATWIIDSGRGYWEFYSLAEAAPVDGTVDKLDTNGVAILDKKTGKPIQVNGPQTDLVESYGRGIEQAYSPPLDHCRNIDRVGRCPGWINLKTGRRARVVEYNPDAVYKLEDFPRVVEKAKAKTEQPKAESSGPMTLDNPEVSGRVRGSDRPHRDRRAARIQRLKAGPRPLESRRRIDASRFHHGRRDQGRLSIGQDRRCRRVIAAGLRRLSRPNHR
jgi:hypothetical protein